MAAGYDFGDIHKAFTKATRILGRPSVIIAKTIMGKGVKVQDPSPTLPLEGREAGYQN